MTCLHKFSEMYLFYQSKPKHSKYHYGVEHCHGTKINGTGVLKVQPEHLDCSPVAACSVGHKVDSLETAKLC